MGRSENSAMPMGVWVQKLGKYALRDVITSGCRSENMT